MVSGGPLRAEVHIDKNPQADCATSACIEGLAITGDRLPEDWVADRAIRHEVDWSAKEALQGFGQTEVTFGLATVVGGAELNQEVQITCWPGLTPGRRTKEVQPLHLKRPAQRRHFRAAGLEFGEERAGVHLRGRAA